VPITLRAFAVGLVCVVLLCVATPLADLLVQSTWLASCHLPIGALVLFLVLVAGLNTALRRLSPRLGLKRHELVAIYGMMLVGAGIPSFGLAAYLIPTLAGINYFSTPENRWGELFYKYLPKWMVPFDPANPAGQQAVSRGYYQGLFHGEAIPWAAWILPVAAWLIFALLLFAAYFCIGTILRRQWVDRERLAFPLVQLPAEMVRSDPVPSFGSAFFRSRLMWLGFAIPAIIHSINSIHMYFPTFPQVPLRHNLNSYLVTWPWNQIGIFQIWTHFSVIGFSFLLAADLSLSLWLFFLLSKLQSALAASYGMQIEYMANYPVQSFQAFEMLGGFVVLAAMMLWLARPHLRDVWTATLRGDKAGKDAGEPLSYRAAVVGLGLTTLGMCAWCWFAGMTFLVPIVAIAILYVVALVLTRFVSEGGLLFIQAPFQPTSLIGAALGSAAIGPANLTVLSMVERVFIFDLRGFLMPSVLDTYRLSDTAALDRRRLTPALLAAVVVAAVVSCVVVIALGYQYGAVRMSGWFAIASPQQPGQALAAAMTNPRPATLGYWPYVVIGSAVTYALYWLRMHFVWWQLHPIGFVMGPSWPMIQLWFSILVGWMLKASILRWGGQRTFARARPFFLGLVLGEYTAAMLWLLIDLATGQRGNMFFLN